MLAAAPLSRATRKPLFIFYPSPLRNKGRARVSPIRFIQLHSFDGLMRIKRRHTFHLLVSLQMRTLRLLPVAGLALSCNQLSPGTFPAAKCTKDPKDNVLEPYAVCNAADCNPSPDPLRSVKSRKTNVGRYSICSRQTCPGCSAHMNRRTSSPTTAKALN